jgi:hypothetical protein
VNKKPIFLNLHFPRFLQTPPGMNPALLGIARHLLTFGAGYLASQGVISAGETEVFVGTGLGLIGIIWSIFEKRKGK